MGDKLRVVSIFKSVEGEGRLRQGKPTTFIRFAGCSIHCSWCDTKESWDRNMGRDMTVQEIFEVLTQYARPGSWISITGGNPMEQDTTLLNHLIGALRGNQYRINVEHPGVFLNFFAELMVLRRVDTISFDLKPPSAFPEELPLESSERLNTLILAIKRLDDKEISAAKDYSIMMQIKGVFLNKGDLNYHMESWEKLYDKDKPPFNRIPFVLQPCMTTTGEICDATKEAIAKFMKLIENEELPEMVSIGVQLHKILKVE